MVKRIIEMYEYRNILDRLEETKIARNIARDVLTSRIKADEIKAISKRQGWILPKAKLPDDAMLALVLGQNPVSQHPFKAGRGCASGLWSRADDVCEVKTWFFLMTLC